MKLIEIEPHFWELYQDQQQLYLSVSVDNSAVTYNWDLHLTAQQIEVYQRQGRDSIVELAKQVVAAVFGVIFLLCNSMKRQPQKRQRCLLHSSNGAKHKSPIKPAIDQQAIEWKIARAC